jgi:predicted dehydrogenase
MRPTSRRRFLQTTGTAAAAATLSAPLVHAGEDNTIRLALIGCGGRGTGAAFNALSVGDGPVQLYAMADAYADRLAGSFHELHKSYCCESPQFHVPDDRKFVGFDAYKQAMDCLRPGDVAILTTPPAFRWPMFRYAIEKGLNVFLEKPVTVDGPSARRMLELNELAKAKNLKVGVGLMCRHCASRQELYDRIHAGEIGDLVSFRSYRQVADGGLIGPRPEGMSELEHQIRNFHGFFWASGGVFMDFMIHNIDECCWMKDAWPVKAQGNGARTYRGDKVDQNFDNYAIEYVFPDGTRLHVYTRNIPGCRQEFASYVHGTKASAVVSTAVHTPAKCRIYSGQDVTRKADLVWAFPQPEPDPYQLEWVHLLRAIREDTPYNEVERGVKASLVTAMGRMACHTGQWVTFDEMLNHPHEFAPEVDALTADSTAPLLVDASGHYPWPEPGIKTDREF